MGPRINWLMTGAAALSLGAATPGNTQTTEPDTGDWRATVPERAHLMSKAKWQPTAATMPIRAKTKTEFKAHSPNLGIPYSNGGHDGRLIGFDINLRTFLAAAANPQSVLYTKDLRGQRANSAAFYGMACNVFVAYTLQLGLPVTSSFQVSPYRKGIAPIKPQTAQGVTVGDILWYLGHIEVVTHVERDAAGIVTKVTIQDSWPPTTRIKHYTPDQLAAYLKQREAQLYHISDYDLWRGQNRADKLLFPNYELDAQKPAINRTLLLDLGDWVPYYKGQEVAFNVMDRDNKEVSALVITREGEIVEKIALTGKGVVTRAFDTTGSYTAYCLMADGNASPACEFSVCDITSTLAKTKVALGEPWEIRFTADNIAPFNIRIFVEGTTKSGNPFKSHSIWLTKEQIQEGRVTVPGDICDRPGLFSVSLAGENRYGRLKSVQTIEVVAADK